MQLFTLGLCGLLGGDCARLLHTRKYVLAAAQRLAQMQARSEALRIVGDGGQQGCLRKIQVCCWNAEVRLRRSLDAADVATHGDTIDIRLQDLRFAGPGFDARCKPHLAKFSWRRAGDAVDHARDLHRDRRGAAYGVPRLHKLPYGANDGGNIDARMLIKAGVFRGDDRVEECRRHTLERDEDGMVRIPRQHRSKPQAVAIDEGYGGVAARQLRDVDPPNAKNDEQKRDRRKECGQENAHRKGCHCLW